MAARSRTLGIATILVTALLAAWGGVSAQSMDHELKATNETVHWGFFSSTLAPKLTIQSGDTVTVEMVSHHAGDDPELMINGDPDLEEIFSWAPTGPGNTPESAMRGMTGSGDGVHVLTGPIYVEGAEPGDILAVEILGLRPRLNPEGRTFGVNAAAWWGFHYGTNGNKEVLGGMLGLRTGDASREVTNVYEAILDPADPTKVMHVEPYYQAVYGQNDSVVTPCLTDPARTSFSPGVTVPCINGTQTWTGYYFPGLLTDTSKVDKNYNISGKFKVPAKLHVGCMGLAPPSPAFVDSIPPMPYGGNLDNNRIGVGATMYYPVGVPGALLSMGDAHLAQGDGELDGTAIETSITGDFRITVIKPGDDMFVEGLDFPILRNDKELLAHGFSFQNYITELGYDQPNGPTEVIYFKSSVDRAVGNAMRNGITLLMQQKGMTEDEAITLLSTAADFGITQLVDGNWGAHVSIPLSVLGEADMPSADNGCPATPVTIESTSTSDSASSSSLVSLASLICALLVAAAAL